MNNNATFCENCRQDVSYSVTKKATVSSFKGEDVEFEETAALCNQCGSAVFVGDIMDSNLKALYDAYRVKHGIISLEQICEMPVKYSIGKRPLSLLFGWGELTFTRYCDGDMPTKQYADTLARAYNDPAYYLSILEDKKDIIKPLTYKKSKSAVLKIMGRPDSEPVFADAVESVEKYKQIILNCIKYGADTDGKATKSKLAKLVYLSDFIWYFLNLSPMSGMAYRKLAYGPVSDLYFRAIDELEENGTIIREPKGKAFLYFLVEKEAPTNRLSPDEVNLIEKIGDTWRSKPTDDIVNFTHEQLPWQTCKDGEVIPYSLITKEEPERVYGAMRI